MVLVVGTEFSSCFYDRGWARIDPAFVSYRFLFERIICQKLLSCDGSILAHIYRTINFPRRAVSTIRRGRACCIAENCSKLIVLAGLCLRRTHRNLQKVRRSADLKSALQRARITVGLPDKVGGKIPGTRATLAFKICCF